MPPPPRDVGKGKEVVQREMKNLSWFKRTMLCMNIAIHKENYVAHKERKLIIANQHRLFKELEKKKDGTPPPFVEDNPPEPSTESEKTVSYEKWNSDLFPWDDFKDVRSMPSSSRNTGKAPMVEKQVEKEIVDDDDESRSKYDDEDEDGDDDEDDATEDSE